MFELLIVLIVYALCISIWRQRYKLHLRRLEKFEVRVHVNGIRGKSTVTRLIAGVLREAGFRTVAKTTGSAAVTIDFDGNDLPIPRHTVANVKEQEDIITSWEKLNPEAMVIECMAIQPNYQEWAENRIVHSTIGVITNVREDHQDVMGESLIEIASSLAHTCPHEGNLIVAEYVPELQEVLRKEAEKRGTSFIVADPSRVSDEEISRFNYLSFKENIAIGLALADVLDIDHKTAMRGMVKAGSDVGVVRLQRVILSGKPLIWANLFAVNDRESMILGMQMLEPYCDDRTVKIGILNNRYDRERRAEQFSDVAVKDLSFDWLITFGDYESLVTRKLVDNKFPPDRIINMGSSVSFTMNQIIETIGNLIPEGYQALLVGFVNIHTPQAEMLISYFEKVREEQDRRIELILNPDYHQYQMAEELQREDRIA